MRTYMLFLVYALVQLVASNPISQHQPHSKLGHLFDEVKKYLSHFPLKQEPYLEAVAELISHQCKADFFCKVEEILQQNSQVLHGHGENKMHAILNQYIKEKNLNCTEELRSVTPSHMVQRARDFFDKVISCIQTVNFRGQ